MAAKAGIGSSDDRRPRFSLGGQVSAHKLASLSASNTKLNSASFNLEGEENFDDEVFSARKKMNSEDFGISSSVKQRKSLLLKETSLNPEVLMEEFTADEDGRRAVKAIMEAENGGPRDYDSPSANFKSSFAREVVQNLRKTSLSGRPSLARSMIFEEEEDIELDPDLMRPNKKKEMMNVERSSRLQRSKSGGVDTRNEESSSVSPPSFDEESHRVSSVSTLNAETFEDDEKVRMRHQQNGNKKKSSNNSSKVSTDDFWMSSTQFVRLLEKQEMAENIASKPVLRHTLTPSLSSNSSSSTRTPSQHSSSGVSLGYHKSFNSGGSKPVKITNSNFKRIGSVTETHKIQRQEESSSRSPVRKIKPENHQNNKEFQQQQEKDSSSLLLFPKMKNSSYLEQDAKIPFFKLKQSCAASGINLSADEWSFLRSRLLASDSDEDENDEQGDLLEVKNSDFFSALHKLIQRQQQMRSNKAKMAHNNNKDESMKLSSSTNGKPPRKAKNESKSSDDIFKDSLIAKFNSDGGSQSGSSSGGELESCRSSDSGLERELAEREREINERDRELTACYRALADKDVDLARVRMECQRLTEINRILREELDTLKKISNPRRYYEMEKELEHLNWQLGQMESSRRVYELSTERLMSFLGECTTALQQTSPAHRKLVESTRAEVSKVARRSRHQGQSHGGLLLQQQQQGRKFSASKMSMIETGGPPPPTSASSSVASTRKKPSMFRAESMPGLDSAFSSSQLSVASASSSVISSSGVNQQNSSNLQSTPLKANSRSIANISSATGAKRQNNIKTNPGVFGVQRSHSTLSKRSTSSSGSASTTKRSSYYLPNRSDHLETLREDHQLLSRSSENLVEQSRRLSDNVIPVTSVDDDDDQPTYENHAVIQRILRETSSTSETENNQTSTKNEEEKFEEDEEKPPTAEISRIEQNPPNQKISGEKSPDSFADSGRFSMTTNKPRSGESTPNLSKAEKDLTVYTKANNKVTTVVEINAPSLKDDEESTGFSLTTATPNRPKSSKSSHSAKKEMIFKSLGNLQQEPGLPSLPINSDEITVQRKTGVDSSFDEDGSHLNFTSTSNNEILAKKGLRLKERIGSLFGREKSVTITPKKSRLSLTGSIKGSNSSINAIAKSSRDSLGFGNSGSAAFEQQPNLQLLSHTSIPSLHAFPVITAAHTSPWNC